MWIRDRDTLLGHGGLFKTPVAGQKLLAGALGGPVALMETAGEGGPWGMALLAAYCVRRAEGQTLEEYLADTCLLYTSCKRGAGTELSGVCEYGTLSLRVQAHRRGTAANAGCMRSVDVYKRQRLCTQICLA